MLSVDVSYIAFLKTINKNKCNVTLITNNLSNYSK